MNFVLSAIQIAAGAALIHYATIGFANRENNSLRGLDLGSVVVICSIWLIHQFMFLLRSFYGFL